MTVRTKHKTVPISRLLNTNNSLNSSTPIMSKILAPKGTFQFARKFNANGLIQV